MVDPMTVLSVAEKTIADMEVWCHDEARKTDDPIDAALREATGQGYAGALKIVRKAIETIEEMQN